MQKLIGVALAASAAMAGAAHAEISGNIALTSDYVFRGISLTGGDPAVQGGFDWSQDIWYAGVWGSSLTEGTEVDIYGGVTPTTGPVEWDLGVIGYFYPGADDDGVGEFDYWELKAAPSFAVNDQISIGGAVYWSPENYGETGDALYLEVNGAYAMSDMVSFSAAYGNQSIDEPAGPGSSEDDYNTWNLGATVAMHGFELDLRYHDSDIDAASTIGSALDESDYDSSFVATLKREL